MSCPALHWGSNQTTHYSLPCPARWQRWLQWSQSGRPGDTICFNIQRRNGDSKAAVAGRVPGRFREPLLHCQYSDSISFRLQYQSVLWDYFPPKCSWFEYLQCTVKPPQLSAGFLLIALMPGMNISSYRTVNRSRVTNWFSQHLNSFLLCQFASLTS